MKSTYYTYCYLCGSKNETTIEDLFYQEFQLRCNCGTIGDWIGYYCNSCSNYTISERSKHFCFRCHIVRPMEDKYRIKQSCWANFIDFLFPTKFPKLELTKLECPECHISSVWARRLTRSEADLYCCMCDKTLGKTVTI